jgi:hypothetical protein
MDLKKEKRNGEDLPQDDQQQIGVAGALKLPMEL